MAGFTTRVDLINDFLCPSFSLLDTSIFAFKSMHLPPQDDDLFFSPSPSLHHHLRSPPLEDIFDFVSDLVPIELLPPFRPRRRLEEPLVNLRSICDRVSALEQRFDGMVRAERDRKFSMKTMVKRSEKKGHGFERKYKMTEESRSGKEQKNYKFVAQVRGGKTGMSHKKVVELEEEDGLLKNYKMTIETKEKDEDGEEEEPFHRSYTVKCADVHKGSGKKKEKNDKKEVKKEKDLKIGGKGDRCPTRVVNVEDPMDHGAAILRQAFARRPGADIKCKGKKKELSPQDAAFMIQETFRAHLLRRSQALRAIRELSVSKTKLKEIRALFHSFSYRNRIVTDQAERQLFSERIIVLLITIDSIRGIDMMVRSSKRSMVDELEAMLDVVDPQSDGNSLSMKRRTFDMPGVVTTQKVIPNGVVKLIEIVDGDEN